MQCGLCSEEIKQHQAHHFMAGIGHVHRTCRKAFERGLHAAADVIRRHADKSGNAVDLHVAEQEVRAAACEFFDGE